jgi:hypothetical protein
LISRNFLNLRWYAWRGSNARPSVPETDALVQLSYRRIQWIWITYWIRRLPHQPRWCPSLKGPTLCGVALAKPSAMPVVIQAWQARECDKDKIRRSIDNTPRISHQLRRLVARLEICNLALWACTDPRQVTDGCRKMSGFIGFGTNAGMSRILNEKSPRRV